MQERSDFDTIIIGSGAGGLSAAICLSRAGQRVLVLEQHDVPGGWCHSFYLNGHRFTPGVHYVGLLGAGESTSELYQGLGIADELVFFRMNPKAYEHCWIGGERIDLPANFDELIESLSTRFPKERKNIKQYLTTVRDVCAQLMLIPKMNGFWDNVTIPWRTRHLGKYGLFSLKTVIDRFIQDPLLKAVLNVQCGDHGVPPGRASFPLHAAVMSHYFSGGYYPMGGGGAIVKAMTNAIKKHGSEVRTSQRVKRILLEGKKAIGVELETGERVLAKYVISNADPATTYRKLVGVENVSPKLVKKLDKTKYSCTSLMLFLTVDMDVRKAGLDSGNIWYTAGIVDADVLYSEMMQPDILKGEEFPGMFISCTTLKDPSSYDGKHHCLEAISFIDPNAFEQFKGEGNDRSAAYMEYKEAIMAKMLKTLEKVVPGIGAHIIHKELGTPLTNSFFINSTNGSVYGTEKIFKQIGPFSYKPKSEVENLYLCGASIMSHGVAGAGYSGVQTAAIILGCRSEDLIKPTGTNPVKTYEAEDPSNYPEALKRKMEVKRSRAGVVGS
ncbi:MAG: NAD(P)/FAD-dependent oxidoreductase [Flavobacteriales bacterium]|nr:NAD(P)/FAD-dependent oxidoreductase [Flavobacteriales bacterium]MBK6945122.1 NAD(P)/FAD-dependent oxidoreductase [Flavobacteriales bacterium]MBK7239470.1 NAD(P)/FAD-dependent oxidoreductase [Flavobacteriales bacterium]MBK9535323.1 NAD(P)/FAD-dependent oxidoreductase [Flavobacteriales bacterium]MBP9138778.1 NAD(P)/FAD-dependent oxidoreductase [Flavobacteriales bacterium]